MSTSFSSNRRMLLLLCGVAAFCVCSFAQERIQPITNPAQTSPQNQTVQNPAAAQPAASANDNPGEMLIGPGDLLEISVFGAPESLKDSRVSAEGTITYPFIGTLKVADMTVREAESFIARKLDEGGYYNKPAVSVLVKEYATQGISVLGEVQKPGIYPLMGPRQVFDAISAAGGLTPKAGKTVVITHRGHPNEPETVPLDNNPKNNISVYPGDTVNVSKAGIVYVVGNVNMPGGYVMENPELSMLQAVALAQGIKPNSSANNSKLIRKGPNGQEQIPVKLNDVLASKAPDVKMRADDILFVPSSPAASAAKRGLEAALQTLTGIAIYHRP